MTLLESSFHTKNQVNNISKWLEDDRPREKLLTKGAHSLSNSELLAILLRSGTSQYNAVQLSQLILKEFDNDFSKLAKCSYKDLIKFKGVGMAKALSIISAMEIFKRKKFSNTNIKKLNTPDKIYEYIKYRLFGKTIEEFWVIFLNNSLKCITSKLLSQGGLNATHIDIRVILKEALNHNAINIVLVHNHPSGNPKPSQKDIIITKKIKIASEMLDISLVDHLIYCDDSYFSFNENEILI